jgi:hypothetical protein
MTGGRWLGQHVALSAVIVGDKVNIFVLFLFLDIQGIF